MKKIILASTSSRRKELLEKTGLKFRVVSSGYEEDMTLKLKPIDLVKFLSKGKAKAVAKKHKNQIIIGADTIVVLGDSVLGKPHSPLEARKMLRMISGKTVLVVTGFTIIDSYTQKTVSRSIEGKVFFKKLSSTEIDKYIKSKEPLDKAGAFAVQGIGSTLIKKIEGSCTGIIGLPMYELAKELKKFGINIL